MTDESKDDYSPAHCSFSDSASFNRGILQNANGLIAENPVQTSDEKEMLNMSFFEKQRADGKSREQSTAEAIKSSIAGATNLSRATSIAAEGDDGDSVISDKDLEAL